MYAMLAIVLAAIVPINDLAVERISILECHHFYDEHGRLVFDQLIGWEVVNEQERVVFWRLIKSETQIPRRDWQHGGYVVSFQDGETSCFRCIRAPSFRERWTQYDVELENREIWPKEKRRELLSSPRGRR